MNEQAAIKHLILQIDALTRIEQVTKVVTVKVRLGALSGISSDSLRQEFVREAQGTFAEGATLEITNPNDPNDPRADDVVLEDVEMAC